MSMCCLFRPNDLASTASVTSPSSILTPPIPASYAIPTAQSELFAVAATYIIEIMISSMVHTSELCIKNIATLGYFLFESNCK